jgi:F-type H+-transporting ATPase subunit b
MSKILLLLASLVLPSIAAAAEESAGHAGVPWWEIFKQAVNFGILVGVLVYFLKKPLGAYLKERTELIRKSIDEATRTKADAWARLTAIEDRMSKLAGEIAERNQKMDAEAEEETRRIREAAQAEIERIRAQVQFAADQEVKKARAELRRESAELSAQAAREIVAKTITPEDQERIVRENIDRIREIVR